MVDCPKFRCDRRCHSQDFVFEAVGTRGHLGEDAIYLQVLSIQLFPRDPINDQHLLEVRMKQGALEKATQGSGITECPSENKLCPSPSTYTQNFVDEIGELRAISGHMLGAAEVQIPELIWTIYRLRTLDLLIGTLVLGFLGCDPLALVDGFNPVEDNIGLLETRFDVEAVFVIMFPKDVTGSVNLTLLSLFFNP
ncbi:hypothetical protein Tco_0835500 [Tanacetum coccineum]